MGFDARVDYQGAGAAPMLVLHEGADAVDVVAGVGAGEGDPEEIVQFLGGEGRVVGEDDEWDALQIGLVFQCLAECRHLLIRRVLGGELGAAERQDPGHHHLGRMIAIREAQGFGDLGAERTLYLARRRNHQFAAAVEAHARIVQRVHGGAGLEVQVGLGIETLQYVLEKVINMMQVQFWGIFLGRNNEVFGQRGLAEAQQRIRYGEQFLRLALAIGHVPLTADGYEQRVHTCGIHRVHGVQAGNLGGHHRCGDLVDQIAKTRVLLRRAAHHRKRPDGILAVIDIVHLQYRKFVGQAIIPQMVPEWAFGQGVGLHRSGDDEVGEGGEEMALFIAGPAEAAAAEHAHEEQFAEALGQRHHRAECVAGWPAHEDAHAQGLAFGDGLAVVHPYAPVDLVVHADLVVLLVAVAAELYAVHAHIRFHGAGMLGVLGKYLRQGDEGPAIHGPALDLRQLGDGGFAV